MLQLCGISRGGSSYWCWLLFKTSLKIYNNDFEMSEMNDKLIDLDNTEGQPFDSWDSRDAQAPRIRV